MAEASDTLRIAVCGSGNRSRTVWQPHVNDNPGCELVGIQDPAEEALAKAVELGNLESAQTFTDLEKLLSETRPDALIVCPIHEAHAAAVEAGLRAGCHVLVEKPFTTALSSAVALTALADELGLRLAVVQNWRTKSVGQALRNAVQDGAIGDVSHVFVRYLRDREKEHLPAYLFEEEDPMLYAVSIHHFDLFRYVLGQEVVSVSGHAARPSWSRYEHPSIMQLWMESDAGVVMSYASTFSSRNGGHIWEENYQFEGELGTLYCESNYSDPPLLLSRRGDPAPVDLTADVEARDSASQYALADTTILENFRQSVSTGAELITPGADNIRSLAVVEAARECLRTGAAVSPADLLVQAGAAEVSASTSG